MSEYKRQKPRHHAHLESPTGEEPYEVVVCREEDCMNASNHLAEAIERLKLLYSPMPLEIRERVDYVIHHILKAWDKMK